MNNSPPNMPPGPSQSPHPYPNTPPPRPYQGQPSPSYAAAPYPHPIPASYYPYPMQYHMAGPSQPAMHPMGYPVAPHYYVPQHGIPPYGYQPQPHHIPTQPQNRLHSYDPSRSPEFGRHSSNRTPRNHQIRHHSPGPVYFNTSPPAQTSPASAPKRSHGPSTPSSPFPLQTTIPTRPDPPSPTPAPSPPVPPPPPPGDGQSPTLTNPKPAVANNASHPHTTFGTATTLDLTTSPRGESSTEIIRVSSPTPSSLRDAAFKISGYRPEDPSRAYGLIISHKAKPPPGVVKFAFMVEEEPEEETSPVSPPPKASDETLSESSAPDVQTEEHSRSEFVPQTYLSSAQYMKGDTAPNTPALSFTSAYSSTAPTSTTQTPSPSSPVSTATSVSVIIAASKPTPTNAAPVTTIPPLTIPASPAQSAHSLSLESSKHKELDDSFSLAPVEPVTTASVVDAPITPAPAPLTIPSKPKPVAKSWADLVRKPESAQPAPLITVEETPSTLHVTGSENVNSVSEPSRPRQGSTAASIAGPSSPTVSTARVPVIPPLHVLLTQSPPSVPPAPLTHPRGLINPGNMCFANVVMQALLYTTPFYKLFDLVGRALPANLGRKALVDATVVFLREFQLESEKPPFQQPPSSGRSTPLTPEQLRRLSWQQDPFVPEFLYDAMSENKRFDSMRCGRQEDAEEFLGFFLDTLHEELLAVLSKVEANPPPSSAAWATSTLNGSAKGNPLVDEREVARPMSPTGGDDSPDGWMEVGKKNKITVTRTTKATESAITRIFGGKLRSVLRTPGAGKDSVTLEPYQPLQLDIQPDNVRTIEDALIHLTHPETVQVHSPARGGLVDATKQVFIESMPQILVVHVKRFVYDGMSVQKSRKVLLYRTKLEIPEQVLAPGQRITGKPIRYRLYGVIYHHGKYANGGHYTIDILRQDQSEWIRIDDTQIEAISESDVAVLSPDKGLDKDKVAYLLFYQRIPDAPSAPVSTSRSTTTAPLSKKKGATTARK